jgi:hypothetical protein
MSATFEEQTFTAETLDRTFAMGDIDSHEVDLMENMPLLEAAQHEVLLRNIYGTLDFIA